MTDINTLRNELVIANRILSHEDIVDSYGHVSVRHPDDPGRFFLAASVSPGQVNAGDILEYGADAEPVVPTGRPQYSERYIHAEIYRQRPDVNAVVHAHTEAVLPFTVTPGRLRPLLHVAGIIGKEIPLWDIQDDFGDTDLLVINAKQAASLAKTLGQNRVVLMRGHGYTAAAASLELTVRTSIYLKINAQALLAAIPLGPVHFLSDAEIDAVNAKMGSPRATKRVWENWAKRAGAEHLVDAGS